MDEAALAKQMKDEEDLYTKDISQKLTEALNSPATRKAADEMNATSATWPYEPTREMLQFYAKIVDSTWKSMERGYSHVQVDLTVKADKGKPPACTAAVKYKGDFKGGKSRMIERGETVASIAREEYGHEAYADILWDANADVFGKQCKMVPAGFGIAVPRVWVPEWKASPKAVLASGLTSKAVEILYPCLEFDVEAKKSASFAFDMGLFFITVDVDLTGTLKAQSKGTIDASFNLRTYEASITKDIGPLSGNFGYKVAEGKADFSLTVLNAKVPGLDMSAKVSLKKGKFNIKLGSKKISYTYKGTTYEGDVTLSADVSVVPKPPPRIPVKAPARAPAPVRISGDTVITVVVVGAVIILAGVAIYASAGTATPLVMQGAPAAILLATAGATIK